MTAVRLPGGDRGPLTGPATMAHDLCTPRSGATVRCAAGGLVLLISALVAAAGPAAAEEIPAAAAEAPPAGTVHCSVTDPALAELSGLVVIGNRLLALNDGGDRLAVHVLDSTCAVIEVREAAVDPYDPEDLALSADGTIWIADIGDNAGDRATVALHALRPDGGTSLYRLSYPDGAHDAEALLMAPDGTPYLVTKEVLGASALYRPVSDLVPEATVALERVGSVPITLTGTPGGPVGRAGQLMVTGGAVSGDGGLVALRTYTDAYLWPLVGSDVPGALAAEPIRVPLPPSDQGEAISFANDDRRLVIAGEGLPSDVVVVPTASFLEPVAAALPPPGSASPAAEATGSGQSPFVSAAIAALVATVVVWIGGMIRRPSRL